MHVDHSNKNEYKNQNSGDSHQQLNHSANANANKSVTSVIHESQQQKKTEQSFNQFDNAENIGPCVGSMAAGAMSSINSSQCSDNFAPHQNISSDYQVFKEINNLNENLKRSKSQTAGGRARAAANTSAGGPPLIPNLDLSRVLPNFSKKQQEEQLKQYKLIQQDLERQEQHNQSNATHQQATGQSTQLAPSYSKALISSTAMSKQP